MQWLEDELGIDSGALLARYRLERDKRLRSDGVRQFVDTKGRNAHYRDDPWADPDFARAPLADKVDVLVVGGGMGAILLGAKLRAQGFESIRFVERGGDFGGVWYWNRYPGAACDTQAVLYLPMLEELGYLPRRKYAPQPEILAHLQRIARHFDLYRDACFQTDVTGLEWDDAAARWTVSTSRGDSISARYVVIPSGPMERPKLPGIPGIESFAGHSFHTSRWDYAYTGSDGEGGMEGLFDKQVAIIGTGATAIQCVPPLAASAKHLYVIQRTPSSIDERDNSVVDAAWISDLGSGWQKRLTDNFTALTTGILSEEDLIQDGWTSIMTNLRVLAERMAKRGEPVGDPLMLMQIADYMKMNAIRDRVDSVVTDPVVAEALKPWYNRFCKRPCFSEDYLPTFNRPNVTLVDTGGKGVDYIRPDGIIVDGHHYPVDCLIYSTGFEFGAPFAEHIGFPVTGRGGTTLRQKWAKGAITQHGVATHGFPNFFFISLAQTGASSNFKHMIEEVATHIAHILGRAKSEDARTIEPTLAGEDAWVAEVDRTAVSRESFQRECTPSYYNAEGDLSRINRRNSPYGGGPTAYFKLLADWRADGTMKGFTLG